MLSPEKKEQVNDIEVTVGVSKGNEGLVEETRCVGNDKSKNELTRYELQVEDINGMLSAKIPDCVFKNATPLWEDLIIGKFVSKAPFVGRIHAFVNKIWSHGDENARIDVFVVDNMTVKFRIKDSHKRASVLERGSWNICDVPMVVSKWNPIEEEEKSNEMTSIPIWVIVKHVPKRLYSWEGLSVLVSPLGKPKMLHPDTEACITFEEAKVFVDVDLTKELPSFFSFTSGHGVNPVVEYVFPWLPLRCKDCSKWGHQSDDCVLTKKTKSQQETYHAATTKMSMSSSVYHSTRKKLSWVNLLYDLPDDLLLNCLARIPRVCNPSPILVSKRFRSLLASMELYETRKLLGCTESCLYVCFLSELKLPSWFILRRPTQNIPNPNPNPNKSSDNVMVSVPTHNYPPKYTWNLIAFGCNIYMIGEENELSSRVFIMDCRSHTWCKAPSMQVARGNPSICVIGGKIYVAGGIEGYNSSNWMECFDPKTQKWEHVSIPDADIPKRYILKSLVIEGNLYLVMEKSVVYRPKENRWDVVGSDMNLVRYDMRLDSTYESFCVIDNVLYCYGSSKRLEWYDTEARSWRVLKGVEELSNLPHSSLLGVRLVDYGGKIAVFWEKFVHANGSTENKIRCAVIALERRNRQEIYGKIEWCDVVHTIPKSWNLKKLIAVDV